MFAFDPRKSTFAFNWGQFFKHLNICALLTVAVWLRCRDLANLPGINGDEAWYGVQAEAWLHGEPIDWRTPTGNLVNPLFFGPQLILHSIFEPSFLVLRSVAVASGLLALLANYWLCRPVFGKRVATVSTIVLAVMPIDVIYSRLAWDASQSLLVCLPAIYWPLRAIGDRERRMRWSLLGLMSLVLAIIVHPTNLFIAPMTIVALSAAWWSDLANFRRIASDHRILIGALFTAGAALVAWTIPLSDRIAAIGARLTSPADYGAFLLNVERLFSGSSVYEYIAGTPEILTGHQRSWGTLGLDLGVTAIAIAIGARLYRRLSLQILNEVCLLTGWLIGLAAFFVMAGPAALAPDFERYGIWIVAPGAILAALAFYSGPKPRARLEHTGGLVGAAICWLLLLGTQQNFFAFIYETGGRSHPTFHTANVEPKETAIAYIARQSAQSTDATTIVASQWWNYWPLKYLSYRQDLGIAGKRIDVVQAAKHCPNTCWRVEFSDSREAAAVRAINRDGIREVESIIGDFSGRPILSIFAPIHPPERNYQKN